MNTIALSIPTGIGAEIGGYAGDAGAVAREFSKYFSIIVNPNVVNAGILSAINDNMYYVEGYAFDEFFAGNLNLAPVMHQNKIGVIFDKQIPENILNIHINTINALKTVKGYDIPHYEITDKNVGISLIKDTSGISCGRIEDENTLLRAAQKLIEKGCNALAVVCFFGDECEDENYNSGNGVDPIGGIEAVISHYITKELAVPAAHSPAFSGLDIAFKKVSPKVASEFISSTYLPCILDGLNKAPGLTKKENNVIKNTDVKCLIVPDGALGSKAVLSCIKNGIEVCTVKNNVVLSIDCNKFKNNGIIKGITKFSSYQECLNFIRNKYERNEQKRV